MGGMNRQQNQMQSGMNMQGGGGGAGPMRTMRQNDRQQNRNTPYNKNVPNAGGNRGGGNFQRRNDNNGQMGNNNPGMNRFDNNMGQMDNRQPTNNFDRGMNSNNGSFDRRGGFDNDNFGGFGEDRRGFALPSFPNDMGQNNFGNDRQSNNGMGGNRRNNGKF